MTSRPRTTSFVDSQKGGNANNFGGMKISSKDGSKVMTVIASPGQGPDRSTEVSYTDTKVEIIMTPGVQTLSQHLLCRSSGTEALGLCIKPSCVIQGRWLRSRKCFRIKGEFVQRKLTI